MSSWCLGYTWDIFGIYLGYTLDIVRISLGYRYKISLITFSVKFLEDDPEGFKA